MMFRWTDHQILALIIRLDKKVYEYIYYIYESDLFLKNKNLFSKKPQNLFWGIENSTHIINGFSIYSDETADDHNVNRGGNPSGVGWRLNRQTSSNRSRDSQEITYVPTSILKGNHNTGSKNPPDDPEVGSNPEKSQRPWSSTGDPWLTTF